MAKKKRITLYCKEDFTDNEEIDSTVHVRDYYAYVLEKGEPPQDEQEEEEKEANNQDIGDFDYGAVNEVQYLDIVLLRGSSGLGFSIAGGTDNPHFDNDTSIYITKVIPGGAAEADGRLKVYDTIVAVDDQLMEDVAHQVCVDALKSAGSEVKLRVKRFPVKDYDASQLMNIVLHKEDKGLGFSIAGGVGNQHIINDNGIFVTKIIEGGAAFQDGRLEVGDRITKVNTLSLENVTHEEAVAILKETADVVSLVVVKPRPRKDGSGSRDKKQDKKIQEQTQTAPSSSPPESTEIAAALQSSSSADDNSQSRRITLNRRPSGLGFNIVGGDNAQGIYVSFISYGGPAEEDGRLQPGDKILQVNSADLSEANHDEAVEIIKKAKSPVNLAVVHDPEGFGRLKSNIATIRELMLNPTASASTLSLKAPTKKSLYVRALISYDKNNDSGLPSQGLSFNFGDILHITNASDDEWWQASLVNWNSSEEGRGIIPSKKRVERKEQSRLKSVKFRKSSGLDESSDRRVSLVSVKRNKSMSYIKRMPLFNRKNRSSETINAEEDDKLASHVILSYEPVIQKEITAGRPIVLLGPCKDRISDDLLVELSDRITTCVPHTTRPPRDGEIHGQDYYFVESRQEMEQDIQNHVFIEAGQLNEHLYGTSVTAVKDVCRKGKHCLLDVSGYAIKREQLKRMTADQARKAFERAQKTEQEFAEYFTTMVQGETLDDLLENVKAVINHESGPTIWVASKEKIEK
ncbi:uncharacterized protein TRIADDRAFT_63520 [Trichoplax adhaerens]|uniref:Uncharacterized protein n=1 Tax=Trichoplax adhaerens TaxID=10228 RepID=B3RLX1_TRIAD|nr:hypothetical protein TRIADDRAFT_63520 [Trichoplax adhaerens]EDV29598.1 hypothetical protein TRIADDRAFT_63520 [Trichoplax adhaerens]|eukprot:XP_002108800.1 hypothetical protein TRIADDRAFT_63520 [Trichoplax adhaerens]